MSKILRFLLLIFVNGVIHGEDILRIQALLDALIHIIIEIAECLVHETLAKFADAVVVGDAAAVLEN